MTMPPGIISIAAGRSQLPLLKRAKQLGYSTIAVDRDPSAPGFAHTDVCINHSTLDIETVIAELRTLRSHYEIVGVLARTTGRALYTAVAVAEEFRLPGLTRELVQIATEKSRLRKLCERYGLPVPIGAGITGSMYPGEVVDFPVIVRPDATIVGKANIRLCRNRESLMKSVEEAIGLSFNGQAEVGSFIEGIDATCLCWAHRGGASFIAWLDELVGIDTSGQIVGLGVSVPSVITGTPAQQAAEEVVTRLISHFPGADALLLVSFRITMEGEPYIIEVHGDLGGDLVADALLPAANPQFDFFKHAILVATGGIQQIGRIGFKPTALYYRGGEWGSSEGSLGELPGYLISQNGSMEENLALLPGSVNSLGVALSVWPLHLEWLEQNSRVGI